MSSVTSTILASVSVVVSCRYSDGVATGVRLCGSGECPGWGVSAGVDTGNFVDSGGRTEKGGSASNATSDVHRYNWVGEVARAVQAREAVQYIGFAIQF